MSKAEIDTWNRENPNDQRHQRFIDDKIPNTIESLKTNDTFDENMTNRVFGEIPYLEENLTYSNIVRTDLITELEENGLVTKEYMSYENNHEIHNGKVVTMAEIIAHNEKYPKNKLKNYQSSMARTVNKSQGQTITKEIGIHQALQLSKEHVIVAVSRSDDINKIYIKGDRRDFVGHKFKRCRDTLFEMCVDLETTNGFVYHITDDCADMLIHYVGMVYGTEERIEARFQEHVEEEPHYYQTATVKKLYQICIPKPTVETTKDGVKHIHIHKSLYELERFAIAEQQLNPLYKDYSFLNIQNRVKPVVAKDKKKVALKATKINILDDGECFKVRNKHYSISKKYKDCNLIVKRDRDSVLNEIMEDIKAKIPNVEIKVC